MSVDHAFSDKGLVLFFEDVDPAFRRKAVKHEPAHVVPRIFIFSAGVSQPCDNIHFPAPDFLFFSRPKGFSGACLPIPLHAQAFLSCLLTSRSA